MTYIQILGLQHLLPQQTSATTTMSATIFDSLPLNHKLSFVHYNVQSIYTNLELLQAELIEFDILAFSETWLNHSVDTEDLILESYQSPERKDREGDNHGGVIIYVKVYSTDRSKAVVTVLVLLFVALWFILRGDLLYVFPCVILFLCFVLVWICRFPLPLGVWEGLRFVIVALPGLFSYLFLDCGEMNFFNVDHQSFEESDSDLSLSGGLKHFYS